MFKALYGLSGQLTADMTSFATTMQVDGSLTAWLAQGLADGSYTYLIVKSATTYEIVEVTGLSGNLLTVLRAQDGTTALAFPTGTAVEFVMPDVAIQAMINERMLGEVNLTGSGIVTVTRTGYNAYNISAPKITITSNSDKVLVGGEFPNFVLSAPLVSGCCD